MLDHHIAWSATARIAPVMLLVLLAGCAHTPGAPDPGAELDALVRRAEAVQARTDGADAQLQQLVNAADAWIKEFRIETNAENLVQSLLLRPLVVHRPAMGEDQPTPLGRGYADLEHLAGQLKLSRQLVADEYQAVLLDVERLIERYDIETTQESRQSQFEIGEPFIPKPGAAPEINPDCTFSLRLNTGLGKLRCFLVEATCRNIGGGTWQVSCKYECIRIEISTGPLL
jgi:hypothetical protein